MPFMHSKAPYLLLPLLLTACAPEKKIPEQPLRVTYQSLGWEELGQVGWSTESITAARPAFQKSCRAFLKRKPSEWVHSNHMFGKVADWQKICKQEPGVENGDFKAFLEQRLRPVKMGTNKGAALLTGYYVPMVEGSLVHDSTYTTPLYGKPAELVTADLGAFDPTLKGQSLTGYIEKGKLRPYLTREEIGKGLWPQKEVREVHTEQKLTPKPKAKGKKSKQAAAAGGVVVTTTTQTITKVEKAVPPVVAWLKSPVDAYFLQVQGSGIVHLPSGQEMLVSYAGDNGYKYVSIGRVLIEQREMSKDEVSLQSLRTWLEEHPRKQTAILNSNPRYIFMKATDDEVKGSLGVPLTGGYSLAVDPVYTPLGTPVFLTTTLTADSTPTSRLMMAQDTGAAIAGPLRGDIYFGTGTEAERLAGAQNSTGEWYVLVPR